MSTTTMPLSPQSPTTMPPSPLSKIAMAPSEPSRSLSPTLTDQTDSVELLVSSSLSSSPGRFRFAFPIWHDTLVSASPFFAALLSTPFAESYSPILAMQFPICVLQEIVLHISREARPTTTPRPLLDCVETLRGDPAPALAELGDVLRLAAAADFCLLPRLQEKAIIALAKAAPLVSGVLCAMLTLATADARYVNGHLSPANIHIIEMLWSSATTAFSAPSAIRGTSAVAATDLSPAAIRMLVTVVAPRLTSPTSSAKADAVVSALIAWARCNDYDDRSSRRAHVRDWLYFLPLYCLSPRVLRNVVGTSGLAHDRSVTDALDKAQKLADELLECDSSEPAYEPVRGKRIRREELEALGAVLPGDDRGSALVVDDVIRSLSGPDGSLENPLPPTHEVVRLVRACFEMIEGDIPSRPAKVDRLAKVPRLSSVGCRAVGTGSKTAAQWVKSPYNTRGGILDYGSDQESWYDSDEEDVHEEDWYREVDEFFDGGCYGDEDDDVGREGYDCLLQRRHVS